MNIWGFLNSPLFLCLISLIWGSLIGNYLTYIWQKRKNKYDLKLSHFKDIFNNYYDYIRILKDNKEIYKSEKFNSIHSNINTLNLMNKFLYKNNEVFDIWERKIIQPLQNLRNRLIENKDKLNLQEDIYNISKETRNVKELMLKSLI